MCSGRLKLSVAAHLTLSKIWTCQPCFQDIWRCHRNGTCTWRFSQISSVLTEYSSFFLVCFFGQHCRICIFLLANFPLFHAIFSINVCEKVIPYFTLVSVELQHDACVFTMLTVSCKYFLFSSTS